MFRHNLLHSLRPLEAAEVALPAWLHFGREGMELKQWAKASAKAAKACLTITCPNPSHQP